jgi:arabinose-5-phosphate isomerase
MHSGQQNPTIELGATWMAVVQAISSGGLGAVNVVNESRELVGIITDGDLRRAIQRADHALLKDMKCEEIMTSSPVVVSPNVLAYDALRLMEDRISQISVLPVVDASRLCVGLIRLHDIVRSGL